VSQQIHEVPLCSRVNINIVSEHFRKCKEIQYPHHSGEDKGKEGGGGTQILTLDLDWEIDLVRGASCCFGLARILA